MEKHIDAMGFILAAIVISISLLGDREARRSEVQRELIRENSWRLRDTLRAGQRLTPADAGELVAGARTQGDVVVSAARLLNSTLILIVVVVGIDALRLIYGDVEHPPDAVLLVAGLMLGAIATGLFGEFHARRERRLADHALQTSDLDLLWRLSESFATSARNDRTDQLVATVRRKFPSWAMIPELEAMASLRQGDVEAAMAVLTKQHDAGEDGYNSPILLAAAMSRSGRLDECLGIVKQIAMRRGEDPVLNELVFDLGLANAHRDCVFVGDVPMAADEDQQAHRLSFDIGPGDFEETRSLRDFGRSWTVPADGSDSWRLLDEQHPVTWLWDLVVRNAHDLDQERLRVWRDSTTDSAALEALGFGCLAVGLGDDAVEFFDAAIRLNSSSPSGHWGWALAYFERSWADKAMTGLKRARTCGLSDPLIEVTDLRLHKRPVPQYEQVVHMFGRELTLLDRIDLSLMGVATPRERGDSPRSQLANAFMSRAGELRAAAA